MYDWNISSSKDASLLFPKVKWVCVNFFFQQTEHTSYTFRLCGNQQNTHSHDYQPPLLPPHPTPRLWFYYCRSLRGHNGGDEAAECGRPQSRPAPQNSHTKEPHHSRRSPTDTSRVYTGGGAIVRSRRPMADPAGRSRSSSSPAWARGDGASLTRPLSALL